MAVLGGSFPNKFLSGLCQAPVLFQGIGHSLNPANSLVRSLNFFSRVI